MKNLPHQSFISKMCKVAAVWLIASNLLTSLSYPVYADDWNTATLASWADGYTITYDGKSYTLASSDLNWYYYWWNNYPTSDTANGWNNSQIWMWAQNNNIWWWGSDTAANWYNPNPKNLEERQWPCGDGYHVPSRWERNAIATAWCHLDSNTCTSSDLQHADDRTASNNLIYIYKSWLGTKFKSDFWMSDDNVWSSSPSPEATTARGVSTSMMMTSTLSTTTSVMTTTACVV